MALFSRKPKKHSPGTEERDKKTLQTSKGMDAVPQKEEKSVPAPAGKAATKKGKGDTKEVKDTKTKKPAKDAGLNLTKSPVRILQNPLVTEKAAYMTMQHAYVFEVAMDATKRDVVAAVRALYNVTPVKVNVVVKQPRAYVARFRNRRGTKKGVKKAYVFLKKGEKLDIM